MMELKSQLLHLEAWARDEIAALRRIGEQIGMQEAALRANDLDAFEAATVLVRSEAEASAERNARRDRLVSGLARTFGVSPRHVTLGSLIERAGPAAGHLSELRRELRAVAQETARDSRRLRRVMVALRELNREILGSLLGGPGAHALDREGSLVDAEA